MGGIFSYRVHLSVKHPGVDPECIESTLQQTARTRWCAG